MGLQSLVCYTLRLDTICAYTQIDGIDGCLFVHVKSLSLALLYAYFMEYASRNAAQRIFNNIVQIAYSMKYQTEWTAETNMI